ncbi:MAG TPA: DUF4097 family beta strand repeat-containing protein [Chloroflexota bacterium]|nr:DUF4097 family beta strand repeat-containing protein [Chloroflexota bacterium]
MSEFVQQVAATGLRHVQVKLNRGDVQLLRIEGESIVIESDDPIDVEQHDDTLQIGPRPGSRGPRGRGRMEMHMGEDMGMRMDEMGMRMGGGLSELSAHLSGLGAQISEAVAMAMDSLGGMSGSDVRIGIPAVLERPTIGVMTGSGDVRALDLTASWSLRTGMGDMAVERCGGTLSLHSGKGDVEIEHFAGPVTATTGAGDMEARSVTDRLELRTGSGDVTVADCPAGGALQSGSGDVDADEIGGSWHIRTGSGDVTLRIDGAASLEVTSGSGDVEVGGGALRRLRVHTSSGDVECASLLIGNRHEIISGHGDIALALADPPGARLQILTGHGDVSSTFPLVRVGKQGPPSHGSARYVGNVGDSSIEVALRTSSGDITITRLEPSDALRAAAREAQTTGGMDEAAEPRAGMAGSSAEEPAMPMPPIPPIPPIPPMPPVSFTSPGVASASDEQARQESPSTPEEPAFASASFPAPAATAGVADSRLRVLQSLQRGEISVEEATALLESLT